MVTAICARAIEGQGGREILFDEHLDWAAIWGSKIPENTVSEILTRFERELEGHQQEGITDHDLAYCCDVAKRIVLGQIFDTTATTHIKRANALLSEATQLYPSVASHMPALDKAPEVSKITKEIDERATVKEPSSADDVPF